MKIDAKRYDQLLDFNEIRDQLVQFPDDESVLHDLDSISPETLTFFERLMSATNTDQLLDLSVNSLKDGIEHLFSCVSVANYVSNSLEDTTILGNSKILVSALSCRRLKAIKRLL